MRQRLQLCGDRHSLSVISLPRLTIDPAGAQGGLRRYRVHWHRTDQFIQKALMFVAAHRRVRTDDSMSDSSSVTTKTAISSSPGAGERAQSGTGASALTGFDPRRDVCSRF